jgi:tRNA pseudouridine-54 N-methylase
MSSLSSISIVKDMESVYDNVPWGMQELMNPSNNTQFDWSSMDMEGTKNPPKATEGFLAEMSRENSDVPFERGSEDFYDVSSSLDKALSTKCQGEDQQESHPHFRLNQQFKNALEARFESLKKSAQTVAFALQPSSMSKTPLEKPHDDEQDHTIARHRQPTLNERYQRALMAHIESKRKSEQTNIVARQLSSKGSIMRLAQENKLWQQEAHRNCPPKEQAKRSSVAYNESMKQKSNKKLSLTILTEEQRKETIILEIDHLSTTRNERNDLTDFENIDNLDWSGEYLEDFDTRLSELLASDQLGQTFDEPDLGSTINFDESVGDVSPQKAQNDEMEHFKEQHLHSKYDEEYQRAVVAYCSSKLKSERAQLHAQKSLFKGVSLTKQQEKKNQHQHLYQYSTSDFRADVAVQDMVNQAEQLSPIIGEPYLGRSSIATTQKGLHLQYHFEEQYHNHKALMASHNSSQTILQTLSFERKSRPKEIFFMRHRDMNH